MISIWRAFLNHFANATFARYVMVGGVNTLVGVALLYGLSHTGWSYPIYTTLAYLISFGVSFTLNRVFTFNIHDNTRTRLIRFMIVNLMNLGIIQLVQIILIEGMRLPEKLAVMIGVVVYLFIGFTFNKKWVFQHA